MEIVGAARDSRRNAHVWGVNRYDLCGMSVAGANSVAQLKLTQLS
jgi:hypothetical protein